MSSATTTKIEKTSTVTNPVIDAKAMEMLVIARISMLMKNPFFGSIGTRLILQNGESWGLPTAATNGRKIYYNSEFICKLKQKEVEFLVGHELLHVLYSHIGEFGRLGDRDHTLFNIACDYAVNRDLIEYGIGEKITTVPCLYDKKYDGMAAEEIYDDLLKNAKKISLGDLAKMLLDQHLDGDEGDGGADGPDKLTAEERQAIKDEIKEAMLAAAQSVGIGKVPGNMKRFIDGLTESKMNWKEILTQQVEAQVKSDFTYMKPSRRGWGCDAVLPSMMKEPTVEVFCFLDMSGSVTAHDIKAFFSEVAGIVEQHGSFNITVGCWDTSLYNVQSFTEDNVDELMSYEPQGGGGTDPTCVFEYLKENEIVPKQMVFFSDGEVSTFGDPDYCPNTLWLIKNNYRKNIECPYGITIQYED